MDQCSVNGCDRPHQSRSFCSNHYRWFTNINRKNVLPPMSLEDFREYASTTKKGKSNKRGFNYLTTGPAEHAIDRKHFFE